ncbi:MAG: translesion error-prone DNA polymerase V autoproteolytic subunit [Planctomycetaceae bacterium]|jgi:DNA polymerase V|nr:translesion error-prone DNA polymerase V autoproteolytic subunit [Planctomycetaceae bacterium]
MSNEESNELFLERSVRVEFSSLSDGGLVVGLDLLRLLVPNPPATFFMRVDGNSMINAGIFHNDLLIVDRSLLPSNGEIVVLEVGGEFVVKRLVIKNAKYELHAENPKIKPIKLTDESELKIWGVVKKVIHFV